MLKYFIKLGLSVAAAAILTGLIWVAQWISWVVLFVLLIFAFLPLMHYCVKLWNEEDCYDLEDFFTVLQEKPWQHKEEEEESKNNRSRIE